MFSDALDREAEWLSASGDGLPGLLQTDGGPFVIIQARWPRTPAKMKRSLYVCRAPSLSGQVKRFAMQRSMLTTHFQLKLVWPMTQGSGSAEDEQLHLEQAVDQILARVQGPLGDKTHGGRFLSVAEDPAQIDVDVDDPEHGTTAGVYTARITYSGDDPDFNN